MAEEVLEEMEEGEGRGLYAVLLLVFLLIVLIGVYMFYTSDSAQDLISEPTPTPTVSESDSPTDETSQLRVGENSIFATATASESAVNVGTVVLAENGYVVIHADDDGSPGEVIGNSDLLTTGEYSNFEIEVETVLEQGEIIYAMLHSDDGDGEYNFPDGDPPITIQDGSPLMMRIEVEEEGSKPEDISL